MNTAYLYGSRYIRATGRGPGYGIPTKASHEEWTLLY
jgi:hypothetical protein